MYRLMPLLLTLLPALALAQVYKWTDAQGKAQFSDRPAPGAEAIGLATKKASPPEREKAPSPARGQLGPYTQFEIVTPEHNATVRDAQGQVDVGLVLEPTAPEGHRLQILLDGTPIAGEVPGTQMALTGVRVGSHLVQARILDARDKVIAATPVITFHLRKPLPTDDQTKR
jgi:hypothetical protein